MRFLTLILGSFLVLPLARPQTSSLPAPSSDWPQWLGPQRNGIYLGPALSTPWPSSGPAVAWKKKVGQGFSGPVVSQGRLILFHRVENEETVECLQADTGKSLWTHSNPTRYVDSFGFDEGPRATPLVASNQVFTLGADGWLQALRFEDGKQLWSVDTRKTFGSGKGFFGVACSPLLHGNALMVNLGGADGAGIVAFDHASGQVLWKSTDAEASYASPVLAQIHRQPTALFFNREGLVALHPDDGRLRFEYPWRPPINASVNASTPLVIDNLVFVSTSYGRGAVVLRIDPNFQTQKVWAADEVLSNHYSSSLHHEGFLYGFDGRQEQEPVLRCVELKTGRIQWSQPDLGSGSLLLAGQEILLLSERGQLLRIKASPDSFQRLDQAQILGFDTRAYPALAQGRFFARDKRSLVCLNLQP